MNKCQENVADIVGIFFEKYAHSDETRTSTKKARQYDQIWVDNIPADTHYEFHCTKRDGMNVAFHIESDDFKKLGTTLKKIVDKIHIDDKELIFDQNWYQGRYRKEGLGRVYINFEHDYDNDDVAQTMRNFIDTTKSEIISAIKEIENDGEE